MPSFDEELNALGSGSPKGGPSFDDELNALGGSSPSGIQFSADPEELAAWNAGASEPQRPELRVQPAEYQAHPESWADTMGDAAIGLGEGVARGVGINPGRAAGYLAEKGAQVSRFFGGDVNPGEYGAHAEQNARALMADAHERSPMAAGMAEGLGEAVPGLGVMAATGGTVNPITMGIASGALSGLGNSESSTLGGMAADAGGGAAFGGLAGGASKMLGGASKFAGGIGRKVGDWADELADSPMTQKAAHWAGMGAGSSAGGMLGNVAGPAWAATGAGIGGTYGAKYAEMAAPGAVRAVGSAARGLGQGLTEVGASGPAQGFAAQALTQQYGRSNPGQDRAESATDQGRGNLLGEAALAALRSDPSVLGDYQSEFAKAAASPETGAVNSLITRLAQKDPKFRTGPMVELQMMTAGF